MLLIKNGKIFTMAGLTLENGCILIEDGKIKDIGKAIKFEDDGELEVIDAKGNWVLPGIIEAHCHIGITEMKKGFEGDDCNEVSNPITPHLRALDAINPMDAAFAEAVHAGITAVMVGPGSSNVVGGQFLVMKTYGRVIDDTIVKDPAAMKIAFGENPKTNYSGQGKSPQTRMAIAAMLREELTKAKQYIQKKKKAEEDDEEFEENFRYECWIPVFEKKIPMKAHVHRTDDIMTAIRIAKEFDLDLTLDHCSEGHLIAKEIVKSGFPAIVGPDLASRNKIEVQNCAFKTVGILNREGVLAAITTDHPVTLIQSLPICAGLAVRFGLDFEEGLKAITINAAKICRVEDRIGSIEIGKDADIAIFNGNPLEVFTRTLYTIINGEVVYDAQRDENPNY
ncbi:amidohydrolase [Anaerosporobacter faecicola]|uniref:amidohydrolase n=1 Tax=Anaerosporobacter faecicola TaxID=2718714 RepID=UPI001438DD50|nr:amidohydrolase [Anaerosporobacter faecicola]